MGYKILIVDDSPVLRVMLHEMLKALGHEIVAEAEDGETAIAKFQEHKPELVTLDLSLPDINGLEVLERIRRILREKHYARRTEEATGYSRHKVEKSAFFLEKRQKSLLLFCEAPCPACDNRCLEHRPGG